MGEKTCSTSPSKVYAKTERTADFLLGVVSVQLNSKLSEIGLELFGRLKDDSRHPEALSGFREDRANSGFFAWRCVSPIEFQAFGNRIGAVRAIERRFQTSRGVERLPRRQSEQRIFCLALCQSN